MLGAPRSEQESLPTISNLGSWNGLLTHLPAGFISATASCARAEELAALTSTSYSTVVLHYPCCGSARPSDKTVLCQLRSGAPSNPSIFQRYPCSHYGRLRVVQPFRGLALQRLMRSAPGTASSISLNRFLCKLFALCNLAHLSTSEANHMFSRRDSPPESRWATSPPRKMALGPLQASHWPPKCSPRSCPAGFASLIEVSIHRWTFAALLRSAAQCANTRSRAILVPNLFRRQMLTNSMRVRFHLPKTGEIVVFRSAFLKVGRKSESRTLETSTGSP